jgi:Cof subfamily protein (haloacid dehalogenase superfamily)
MPPIRLVALDLDGTLISSKLRISSGVRKAIARARESGVHFTMATGRMFRTARPFAREIGIDGPIICYQGAATYVVATEERLSHVALPAELASRVFARVAEDGVRALGYFEDELYTEVDDAFLKIYTDLTKAPANVVASLDEFFRNRETTKINCVVGVDEAPHYAERLRSLFGDEAYVTRSQPEFVEVLSRRVDKGCALTQIAEFYGVSTEETMAVGDSWNDLPLLARAGWGVAMGTAPTDVKLKAHAVVADAENDGVAEALEQFVLN